MADKDKKFIGEHGVDFREEIRIGLFWREMLGDDLYLRYDADDMVRWYLALELAGPVDIRARLEERASNRPLKNFQGLSRAPHPPIWMVEKWLELRETKVRTLHYWGGAFATVVLLAMISTFLSHAVNLHDMNPLIMNPPQGLTPAPPRGISLSPSLGVSPPAVPHVQAPTGPKNVGISGQGAGGLPSATPP